MIRKVLIANRGVAAVRIARTLRRLGIPHVAVYSEADRDLPFVREADEAVLIGKARPQESYLNGAALIEAMRRTGADALHPGYGFLSENAAFAAEVSAAGFTFIGPEARHIADLGDKARSRSLMAQHGFPVLPASTPIRGGEAAALADGIGYPLLIKASAGGGGVGMQRVHRPEELDAAIGRARGIAERLFKSPDIYMERWLEDARHVEFQIVADGQGRAISLFDRDCSVQRRHQKIIEEAPVPFAAEAAMRAMGERLAALFAALGYRSLATVEMLMDRQGGLHFLEVNTRLQVEHGVTEAITGLDLVEAQLALADGAPLPAAIAAEPRTAGHAIEARIYAEDPVRFLPSPGPLTVFRPPAGGEGLTMDIGYGEGATVTPFYDPMLALIVAHGPGRAEAARRLDAALAEFAVEGVKTNIPFLRRMLGHDAFHEGRHHTTYAEAFAAS